MRILLTGSTGYLGAVARRVLEENGHEVVGLDTGLYDGCDLMPLPAPPSPERKRDIRDVTAADVEGVDAVGRPSGCALERPARRVRREFDLCD